MMEMYYFRDDPVPFDVRIFGPLDVDVDVPEINRHNYLKVERDHRRRCFAENPEDFDPYEISDDDDDVGGPGRFRTGCRWVWMSIPAIIRSRKGLLFPPRQIQQFKMSLDLDSANYKLLIQLLFLTLYLIK